MEKIILVEIILYFNFEQPFFVLRFNTYELRVLPSFHELQLMWLHEINER